jgi:hypothetical protein
MSSDQRRFPTSVYRARRRSLRNLTTILDHPAESSVVIEEHHADVRGVEAGTHHLVYRVYDIFDSAGTGQRGARLQQQLTTLERDLQTPVSCSAALRAAFAWWIAIRSCRLSEHAAARSANSVRSRSVHCRG